MVHEVYRPRGSQQPPRRVRGQVSTGRRHLWLLRGPGARGPAVPRTHGRKIFLSPSLRLPPPFSPALEERSEKVKEEREEAKNAKNRRFAG